MSKVSSDTGPFGMVPEWVILHPNLSAQAIRVYAVLAIHADRKNDASWPGRKSIADEAQCSLSTCDRALGELAKEGALKIETRNRGDGGQTSNLYTVIRRLPLTAPVASGNAPPLVTDEHPKNQNHIEPETEPPRQSEIDSSSPPQAAQNVNVAEEKSHIVAFYAASEINKQVAALVDIAKTNHREVRGGRLVAILKQYGNRKAELLVAFMVAIARNVAVIEDYTEGVLKNGQTGRRPTPSRQRLTAADLDRAERYAAGDDQALA